MKQITAILLAGLLSGCQSNFTADEKILARNGLLRQGGATFCGHAPPGCYPSEVLAYANAAIKTKMSDITGDLRSECFIAPVIGGYELVILSKKDLTDKQRHQISRYVDVALATAWKETEIYRRDE